MKLNGRPPKVVLESDVRRAMKHTLSNAQAAKFLGINKITYKKYASQYFDADGVSLYEKHCNPNGKGITRNHTVFRGNKYQLQDILDGKVEGYPFFKLKTRLFNEALKEEKCECCGFEERRITDYTIPLLLTPIDGDKTNYSLDNLQVVCYNCFYLTVGNLFGKGSKIKFTRKKGIRDQIDDDMYETLRKM